jgi:hypothetical protein
MTSRDILIIDRRSPQQKAYHTHPGGGIMGAPGRLAALETLKDLGAN